MPLTCGICGKGLHSNRSYAGHMLLAHGKRTGIIADMDGIKLSLSELQRQQSANTAGIKRIMDVMNRYQHLEKAQAVRGDDGRERLVHSLVYLCDEPGCQPKGQAVPKVAEPAPTGVPTHTPGEVKIKSVCKSPVTVAQVHTHTPGLVCHTPMPGVVVKREPNKGGTALNKKL